MGSLTPTERDVLLDLRRRPDGNGDNIQSNIMENTDRTMKSVGSALESLENRGLVVDKGRGVYRLTEEGETLADQLGDLGDAL